MTVTRLFCAVTCLLLSTYLPGQSKVSIKLKEAVIHAGDQLVVTVEFDTPPSYAGRLNLIFTNPESSVVLLATSLVTAHQPSANAATDVPIDTVGGRWTLSNATYGISGSRYLQVPSTSFDVVPQAELVSPSAIAVALVPSQKQFLATEESKLNHILSDLLTELGQNASDTMPVRSLVATTLQTADKQLLGAQSNYTALAGNNLTKNAIFFEDLHRQYGAAVIELRAPASASTPPLVVPTPVSFAQQDTARIRNKEDVSVYAGSYPLRIAAALQVIARNLGAYKRILETGSDSFTFSLHSTPTGATIAYRRTGEDFRDYSAQTNVDARELPLALWTFRVSKQHCRPELRYPDPYLELSPSLEVHLACQGR